MQNPHDQWLVLALQLFFNENNEKEKFEKLFFQVKRKFTVRFTQQFKISLGLIREKHQTETAWYKREVLQTQYKEY